MTERVPSLYSGIRSRPRYYPAPPAPAGRRRAGQQRSPGTRRRSAPLQSGKAPAALRPAHGGGLASTVSRQSAPSARVMKQGCRPHRYDRQPVHRLSGVGKLHLHCRTVSGALHRAASLCLRQRSQFRHRDGADFYPAAAVCKGVCAAGCRKDPPAHRSPALRHPDCVHRWRNTRLHQLIGTSAGQPLERVKMTG